MISPSETAIHFADLDLKLQNPKSQALSICSHLLDGNALRFAKRNK